MNFKPFDLHNEISIYFDQWSDNIFVDLPELTDKQLNKLVKIVSNHDDAEQVYEDFELWFSGNSIREDVMSETFMEILDDAFMEMFADFIDEDDI